jgi:hypothetical protein
MAPLPPMSIYSELGVKRVINAAFALTPLGSTVPREAGGDE